MNKFTDSSLNTIRTDINKALAVVAEKHSISLKIGSISYESTKFTTKITSTIGDGTKHAQKEFVRNCWRYDIPESWYGKQFKAGGQTFEISGINTRARKNPINFKDVKSGKSFRSSIEYIKTYIND